MKSGYWRGTEGGYDEECKDESHSQNIVCGIHPMHFAKVTIFRKEICKGFQTQV